jgi:hypothetical protein
LGWQTLKRSFAHAFAVEQPGVPEPSPEERAAVDRVCEAVVRRRMATPALTFLHMTHPLNFVAAQVLHFFQPIVSGLIDTTGYGHFAAFLERRGSIEYICRRLETLEARMTNDEIRMTKE